jgi:hypothetical protein
MLRKMLFLLLIILVCIFCAVSVFAIDSSKEQPGNGRRKPPPKANGVKPLEDALLWEGFESGLVPPPGWTLLSTSTYTWGIDADTPYEGNYNASCFYDENLNQQDEVLISPTFTGSGMILEFYLLGSVYWAVDPFDNYDIKVWVVIGDWDGGLGDDILITEDALEDFVTENWVWTYCNYSLPAAVNDIPIAIAFQYWGLDGAQGSIDAISVEGEEPTDGDFMDGKEFIGYEIPLGQQTAALNGEFKLNLFWRGIFVSLVLGPGGPTFITIEVDRIGLYRPRGTDSFWGCYGTDLAPEEGCFWGRISSDGWLSMSLIDADTTFQPNFFLGKEINMDSAEIEDIIEGLSLNDRSR